MDDEGLKEFTILACTRNIGNKPPNIPSAEHCFIKLVHDSTVVDSRGFFSDVGSVQEPVQFFHEGNCKIVKTTFDIRDWDTITSIYEKNKNTEYHLTSRNCCKVAKEAIESLGISIPKNIETANCSVGTKSKIKNDCTVS